LAAGDQIRVGGDARRRRPGFLHRLGLAQRGELHVR
jgi:hypothetical protein